MDSKLIKAIDKIKYYVNVFRKYHSLSYGQIQNLKRLATMMLNLGQIQWYRTAKSLINENQFNLA